MKRSCYPTVEIGNGATDRWEFHFEVVLFTLVLQAKEVAELHLIAAEGSSGRWRSNGGGMMGFRRPKEGSWTVKAWQMMGSCTCVERDFSRPGEESLERPDLMIKKSTAEIELGLEKKILKAEIVYIKLFKL